MKSPRLGMTSTSHTARAMMSQRPVKRVSTLFPSVSASFIPLTLSTGKDKHDDSEITCCYPQPYHIIPSSPNRYGKRYESADFANLHVGNAALLIKLSRKVTFSCGTPYTCTAFAR